jgi:hypothetical protein
VDSDSLPGDGGAFAPAPRQEAVIVRDVAQAAESTQLGLPGSSPQDVDQCVELRVTVPGGMTAGAVEHFATCVDRFALDLSRETSRLEEAARAKSIDKPEITSTMVIDADQAVRNSLTSKSVVPTRVLIAQALAFATGILAPISGAYLHSWLQWVLTSLFGVIAIAAQTYAIFALRRR